MLLNLLGYYYCNIKYKGSTNFINDCSINFNNNNFHARWDIDFYKNINLNNLNVTNNQLNISKFSLEIIIKIMYCLILKIYY